MKKISVVLAGLLVSASLNAAVVASVNGKNIDEAEINEALAPLLRGQKISDLSKNEKDMVIRQYIAQLLVLDEARKQNLEKDARYKKELEKAKDLITLNLYQDQIFQAIKVDEAKVKSIYDQNKADFVLPARVKAKHILVASEAEAKDIINQLKKFSGKNLDEQFSEVARAKSIDTASRDAGGELDWFEESKMVPEFSKTAFSLKNGQMSQTPVKTQYGYHIILKEKSEARKQLSFSEAKASIEYDLKMLEFRQKMAQKAQELYSNAKVEIK